MKTTQTKLQKSQIEIEFELTEEEFKHHIEHALEHLKKHVKVDGFRKGNVPLKMVEERVGKENLLMEAGDIAVKEVYSKYILDLTAQAGNSPKKELAGKEADFKVKLKSVQKMELPEISDEFAKELGAFDTLVALKQSMKEGMMQEKQEEEKQRKRGEILEKIAEKSKFETPETMVNYEKERLLEDLKNKIAQTTKVSFEEYLAAVKQTEESIKETYQKEAEKRIKNFLILKEVGKKEGIEVQEEEVAKIDTEQLKEYTKGVIYNEKVF